MAKTYADMFTLRKDGHSTITLTRDVYTHIRQARRKDTAQKLNDYFSPQK